MVSLLNFIPCKMIAIISEGYWLYLFLYTSNSDSTAISKENVCSCLGFLIAFVHRSSI